MNKDRKITIIIMAIGFIVGFIGAEIYSLKKSSNCEIDGSYIIEEETLPEIEEAPKEEKIEKGKIPLGVHKYTIRKDTTPTKQNNAMSSINGIPVSKGGDFDITIDNIDIHIKSMSVLCPNELCSNHIWGELNFQFLDDYAGPCVCKKCKTPVYYSKDTIKTIYYNCPFCGLDEGSTCDWDNFCPNCGNDMRAINRALMNYNWESR